MTALVDRFHFLARAAQAEKTPIRAEAPASKTADGVVTLRLYDPIDSWGGPYGVSAKEFAEVLDALPNETTELRLHVHSPGGEVWEGLALLNLLRQHPARVVAVIDGLAASTASFVVCGADEVLIAPSAEVMVHEPWGLVVGNSADMQKMAGDLDHEADNLAGIYTGKAGGTVQDWRAVMAAETWFSAEEAVAAGLADRLLDADPAPADVAAAKARFDLTIFAHAGRAQAPAPQTPAAPADGPIPTQERSPVVAFSDEQLTTLRQQVGVADDADGATILAALAEALTEQADPNPPTPLPAGTVAIDSEQLQELQVAARAGQQARAQQETEHREQLVAAAVADGRIPPARRDAWLASLAADPGSEQTLAALAPGLIPVGAPLGHTGQPDNSADDDVFEALFGAQKIGA